MDQFQVKYRFVKVSLNSAKIWRHLVVGMIILQMCTVTI